MRIDDYLRIIITICGAVFAILSFIIIFKGKSVGQDNGKKNIIKFRGFELRANGVIMLVVISMFVFILPFSLPHFVKKGLDIGVHGYVQDSDGNLLEAIDVELYKNSKLIETHETDEQGFFNFPLEDVMRDDTIYLIIKGQRCGIIPTNKRIIIDSDETSE